MNPADREFEELEKKRGAYNEAVALVKGSRWGFVKDAALARISEIVKPFDGDANKAAFALGQVREALQAVDAPLKTIRDFESSQKSLDEVVKIEGKS